MTVELTLDITLDDVNFIANALRTAAEVYDRDAEAAALAPRSAAALSLHQQFMWQAEKARKLAELLEAQ